MPHTETLVYSAIGLLIFLILLYYVIKWAVASGIKESGIYTKISLLSRLKIRELRKQGVEGSEINEDRDSAIHD